MLLHEKKETVRGILAQYERFAIAFSGGADSSLLLRLALDTVGPENLLVLTARSSLLKPAELEGAATWFERHAIQDPADHAFVEVEPLAWDEFVRNPSDRCYLCKSKVYGIFLDICRRRGFVRLVDGTNADDMNSSRPGLRALRELGIGTPLAAGGMSKEEVRSLSREMNLDTWDHPSASCLATRIPVGLEVTAERLDLIAALEAYLENQGFSGCRVRLDRTDGTTVYIQVRHKDLSAITATSQYMYLSEYFSDFGIEQIYLDLKGR